MIGIMLLLMKVWHDWIDLKKVISKSRKRTTVWKQPPLDNKLFLRCCTFKTIVLANNTCIYLLHLIYNKVNEPELRKDYDEFCRQMRIKWHFRNEPSENFSTIQHFDVIHLGNHLQAILT